MSKVTKELKKRSEIPVELTWRLEDIFATSADKLYNLLKLQDELSERLGKLYTYAHMRYDQDTTNSFYQGLNAKAEMLLTKASSVMSYIVPEILAIEEEKIEQFLNEK